MFPNSLKVIRYMKQINLNNVNDFWLQFNRLMVIAEIFSLLLYVLSLVILHDYFGKYFNIKKYSRFWLIYFILHCNSRLGFHLVIWILVESACNHLSILSAVVYHKISAEEVLTASLFEIVLKHATINWDLNAKSSKTISTRN